MQTRLLSLVIIALTMGAYAAPRPDNFDVSQHLELYRRAPQEEAPPGETPTSSAEGGKETAKEGEKAEESVEGAAGSELTLSFSCGGAAKKEGAAEGELIAKPVLKVNRVLGKRRESL